MTSVDMWIEPAMNRDQEIDYDQNSILFNWTAISIEGSILTINLNFGSPL